MTDLVEEVARALAAYDGYDPDETWEEYDRNAGATVACMGEYPGWQDDVFPKTTRWQEYEGQARAAIAVVIERCAKVADDMREKHSSPVGDNYSCGVWDQSVRIRRHPQAGRE